ncbi:MAG: MarR family transcriptional regulator [Balneolaceae bacterium]
MNTFHSTVNSFSRNLTTFFDDQLEDFGLATSYVELMILMKENDKISQKEVAEELSLAPSTITRFVDKLQKKGLVEKTRSGREVSILLTADGLDAADAMHEAYLAAVENLRQLVGDKYMETTEKLLDYGSSELSGKQD